MQEKRVYTHPTSGVNYYIDAYELLYSQNRPSMFCMRFEATIPRHERPNDQIRVGMEIKSILYHVNSQNPPLATYLKSVLESFKGQVKYEMLAFRSLEQEGFDMFKIVECIMNDADITFSGDK